MQVRGRNSKRQSDKQPENDGQAAESLEGGRTTLSISGSSSLSSDTAQKIRGDHISKHLWNIEKM